MNAVQFVRAWETHAQSPQALRRRYGSQRVILSSSFVPPSVRFSLGNVWSADLCRRLHLKSFKLSKPISAVISLVPKEIAGKSLSYTRTTLTRTLTIIGTYPRPIQCIVAVCVITFAFLGLAPSIQFIRRRLFQRRDWDKSRTKHIVTSYIRPLILWAAVLVICRGLDPIVLSSETSQAVKDRFVNFLRSLSTVLTFAYCTARITRHIQKVMMERQNTGDSRNLGTRFISTAVSTSVWVAAVCLFMELLGFSTQKWLTAGGFGTVLLTLAGREIFTNFLSSVMIHATRPFVEFEWVQTKIDGQEVSGTVEHVGWWSPTIIRGEDREAVHIPNNKFTMSVVRNLSQKTHWRIKTYIGLSHLDANKINLIVADMRKVLSKQPQVEHRRLHRRVFFDNIDPVNQSLMIMVSCFVKTSHYEEYLSVKEIVLLNLLKVISHHNARLATPIRTIQRIYDEVETRQSPYRNVSTDGKPLLLVEASAVTTDKEIVKQEVNTELNQTQKPALEGLDSMGLNAKDMSLLGAAFEKPSVKIDGETVEPDSSKQKDANKEAKNAKGVNSKDLREPGKVKTKEPQHGNREVKVKEPSQQDNVKVKAQKDNAKPQEQTNAKEYPKESSKVKAKESQQPKMKEEEDPWREPTQSEEEKLKNLEENIVLGVALAGCKRTLPLDGQEFAASNNMENSTSHKIGDKST